MDIQRNRRSKGRTVAKGASIPSIALNELGIPDRQIAPRLQSRIEKPKVTAARPALTAAMTQIGPEYFRFWQTFIGPDGHANDVIAGGGSGSNFIETHQLKPPAEVVLENSVQHPTSRAP